MLKKITKSGNSNAIVLDKPILDLLNLDEGSLVKITTDGTTLIIKPYKNLIDGHYIAAGINFEDSYLMATFEEQFKHNLTPVMMEEQKVAAYNRFQIATRNYLEASRRLGINAQYQKELQTLTEQYKDAPLSSAALDAANVLRLKYEPNFTAIEDEFRAAIAITPTAVVPTVHEPIQEQTL